MGLQSAFDMELSTLDQSLLERIRKMIVQQLLAATRTHRHPWHLGTVATCSHKLPKLRTVVLRSVAENPLRIRFHTDVRSRKVAELRETPVVEWLFYEAATRIQVRVGCAAEVLTSGDAWQQAWEETGLPSRRCYLGPFAPGKSVQNPEVNLPTELVDRNPTQEESEGGRINFAIVDCRVERIEWLYLKHNGHLRCQFEIGNVTAWNSSWLAP